MAEDTSQRISVSIEKGIADVRFNRPDKMNALDGAMFEAIIETGKALAANPAVRVAVLSGEGRAFCAGLDFTSFAAMAAAKKGTGNKGANLLEREAGSAANRAQLGAWTWAELPFPVIAAVHGVAFGGGLQIALAADIRFATPDARFSVMEIKWGLIPDMSGTQTLRHLVGLDVAKELAFTGREISGEEALKLGLVTHLSETPRDAAFALAREIAAKSPDAIRAGKALFQSAFNASVEDGLKLEEQAQLSVIGKPNQIEAVKANLKKRDPEFEDSSS